MMDGFQMTDCEAGTNRPETGLKEQDSQLLEEMTRSQTYPVRPEHLWEALNQTQMSEQHLRQFLSCYNDLQERSHKVGEPLDRSEDFTRKEKNSSLPSLRPRVRVLPLNSGDTCDAQLDIMNKLTSWFMNVETTKDRMDCDIIIIFCPVTSRVAADVDAAMRMVTGEKPVILVVMHHTRDPHYCTDATRWSDKFPHLLLDVAVLFHETKRGLLKCPGNDEAIEQIQAVLKKRSSRWRK